MSEILINTTTAGVQQQPAITTLGGSHFLIVWANSNDLTIRGRLIQANPLRPGGEFVVNTPTSLDANTVRQLPAISATFGGPVVAWVEQALNPPGPRPQVKLRRFNRDGQRAGPVIPVSSTDVDPRHRPGITGMIDGGFLVTWIDARRDHRVLAQRFGPEGATVGDAFLVNATPGFHEAPVVTLLKDGNYVIAWRSDPSAVGGGALIFRIFDFEGSPVVGETRPNLLAFTGQKAITALDNGQFAIAHVRKVGTSDIGVETSEVQANIFKPDGASANIPIFLTSGREIHTSSPTLAGLPGTRFVAGWVQKGADTVGTSPIVKARVFSGAGESVGIEADVSTATAGGRADVCGAAIFTSDSHAPALFAWVDDNPSRGASNPEIHGRVLSVSDRGIVNT